MIRTLIVDDEPLARERLARMLEDFADIEPVGEAENGADAVAKIECLRPDLVFLDIHMPDMDGFAVMRLLDVEPVPLVVFVTAYDQHAVNAFEVNAIDYVLKPVRRQRLDQAMAKIREKRSALEQSTARLKQSLRAVSPAAYMRRLPVRNRQRILIVNADQITSFVLDQGLVFATTVEGRLSTKYTTLSQLETQLDPAMFLRVHRLHIVNLNQIREVVAHDNNTADLVLSCGNRITVSRGHIKELRQALNL